MGSAWAQTELVWLTQLQGDDRGLLEVAAKPLGATVCCHSAGGAWG